jgi:hypothetical protein
MIPSESSCGELHMALERLRIDVLRRGEIPQLKDERVVEINPVLVGM